MNAKGDLAVALAFVAMGIVIVLGAAQISEGSVRDPIGTGGLPTAIGVVIIVLGLGVAGRRFLQLRRTGEQVVEPEGATDEADHPAAGWRPLLVWVLGIAYVQLLPTVGFVFATPVLVGLLLWLMGIRNWVTLVSVSIGFTVVAYGLFEAFLKVNLP